MALISRDKIDELIQTIDIVDVISEYVSLQPSGKSMKGLCPFHNEKTPSFHVSKDKQIFNCFGCHKKGNVITFIQEYKHLDFIESVRYLADQFHIDLGEDDHEIERYNYRKLYDVNKLAKDFFNLNLLNLDVGKNALDYLIKRQMSKQTLSQFEIGYAPSNGQALLSNLKEKFQEYELVEAGLIGRNDSGNYYDLFRNRIMFPIYNDQGKVLGFSGRRLNDDKNQPKYINTQSTKIFNKGTVLYNLHRALPFVNQKKRIVLMEGFFDVIQASIAGVEEAVCSMGTELTFDQARKIKKYTDSVVICYDGDQAGKEATYRALSILEKANLNVQIALMPDGLDPDDYIKQYSQSHFRNQLNQKLIDKFDFVYEMIIQKGLSTSSEIETAKNSLFKFLVNAASKTITTIYLQKFAEAVHLSYDVINQDFQKYLVNQRRFQTIEKT
ncbi:MAG TPA: DNA primase, partial [Candidatus Izemoplasmatales bacterium]|nr:DNA primase [Candidatus Izemoplasmatales bacterium]